MRMVMLQYFIQLSYKFNLYKHAAELLYSIARVVDYAHDNDENEDEVEWQHASAY